MKGRHRTNGPSACNIKGYSVQFRLFVSKNSSAEQQDAKKKPPKSDLDMVFKDEASETFATWPWLNDETTDTSQSDGSFVATKIVKGSIESRILREICGRIRPKMSAPWV